MKKKSMGRNIVNLIFLTIILKIVGFISRSVIAYYFGTSGETDIYYTATGFIDSIAAIALSGLSVGIINIYIKSESKKNREAFLSNLLMIVIIIMVIVGGICFGFANILSRVLIAECTPEIRSKLIFILRILCFSYPFQGMITVLGAAQQAEKRFTIVKLTGTITSLSNIGCAIFLANLWGINALTISYVLGTVINAMFLLVNVRKTNKLYFKRIEWNYNIKLLLSMTIPLIAGMAAHQINLIIDKSIASKVAVGAISALSYSSFLYLCIENIFIQSVATAIFPEIAEESINNAGESIANKVNSTLLYSVYLLIPITFCCFFNSEFIVEIVYMRGNFDLSSLSLTQMALKGYVIGLPFLAMRDVITRVYYSYSNTKYPMRIGLIAVTVNIVLDIILVEYVGIFGITIATSIANALSGILLYLGVDKHNAYIKNHYMNREFIILGVGSFVTIILCIYITKIYFGWIRFILTTILSVVCILVMAYLGKSKIIVDLGELINKKRK